MGNKTINSISIIDCDASLIARNIDLSSASVLNISDSNLPTLNSNVNGISNRKKGEIQKKALKLVNEFGNLKVGGKTIKEVLAFDNSTIYFFHRFKILHQLTKHLVKVEEIENQINDFESCLVYTSEPKLIKHFENSEKVQTFFIESGKEKLNIQSVFQFMSLMIWRLLKGLMQYKKALNLSIAVVDRPTDYVSNKNGFKNPFFENLFKKNSQELLLISEIPIYGFKGRNRFKWQKNYGVHDHRKNVIFGEFILLQALLFQFKKWKQHCEVLHSGLNQSFDEHWDRNYKLIWEMLIGLKSTTDLYLLKEMAYSEFFKKSQLEKLIVSDENSLSHRTIVNAAKINEIMTYGVQHGAIGISSANYIYHPSDFNYSPIPDLTFIWGQHWKEILEDHGNYPSDSIEVVGQLRTDEIHALLANRKEKKAEKKRILFATQPMPDEEWRENALLDVLKLASKQQESDFIIRPHPRETDKEYFESRINRFKVPNVSIDGFTDLYAQLAGVDLLITCYSTVAIEALYFKLPVLLIDYNEMDILNFSKNNLSPLSRSYQEIEFNYKLLLEGNFDSSTVDEYIEKYAYKIDGKVANRIWNTLV